MLAQGAKYQKRASFTNDAVERQREDVITHSFRGCSCTVTHTLYRAAKIANFFISQRNQLKF